MVIVGRVVIMVVAVVLLPGILASEFDEGEIGSYGEEELAEINPYMSNDKLNRHIHSMINAYRDDIQGGRMVVEMSSPKDSKYKTWKRNADLINSLLALPKGMNDAGR